jgi:hypothetical protein
VVVGVRVDYRGLITSQSRDGLVCLTRIRRRCNFFGGGGKVRKRNQIHKAVYVGVLQKSRHVSTWLPLEINVWLAVGYDIPRSMVKHT